MNFLSHYYFDRESADPEMVLGGVLPDLIKNADKTWNLHPEKKPYLFQESPRLGSILTGWQRHLAIDRHFHSSGFFVDHTRAIRKLIAPILSESQIRPSFMAHISLELMLDSLLIICNKIDAASFYEKLALAERHSLQLFLELNLITDTERFFKFFDEFLEVNYLHNYRQSENLVYALNRICMRIWHEPMTEEEKFKLSVIFLGYQENLKFGFLDIFKDIDERLKSTR